MTSLKSKKNIILVLLFLIILPLEIGTVSLFSFLFTIIVGYTVTVLLCLMALILIKRVSPFKKWVLTGVCILLAVDHVLGAFLLKGLSKDPAFLNSSNLWAYWPNFAIAGLAMIALTFLWIKDR